MLGDYEVRCAGNCINSVNLNYVGCHCKEILQMNTVLILSLLSVLIMSCMTQQQVLYAFKVWNVNLPAQTIINRTTITDTGKCSYDAKAGTGYSTLESLKAFGLAVQKENTKDKQMSVSDLTTMFSIYDKDKNKHFKWCGME